MRFQPRHRSGLRLVLLALLTAIFSFIFWIYVSLHELTTGKRLLPWHAYGECAPKPPESLPTTVRIGFYEEFPNPWRLAKLSQLDFPITLAIAAPNRQEFERLHDEISANYPMVREVIYWPTLSLSEGYYLGGLSEPQAIQRVIDESRDLPLLWDLELPRQPPVSFLKLSERSLHNRPLIGDFFRHHQQPIHIWRTHTSMGLDPLFLRSLGMQYSPDDAAQIRLHLDLYTMGTGAGANADDVRRITRCGIQQYGERFIPSLGVLNDQEGPEEHFVTVEDFRRNLQIVREEGAAEVWIFGSNGLNQDYLQALHDILPLEKAE
jgi:hypothetical protein